MSIRIGSEFKANWQVFWATTYTFEMNMFEEFWLRRLGDPPLNATILVDFDRLAHLWDQFAADEEWRLKRANQDYLVRGIRAGTGAFHPKTYFFGNDRDGVLLVGSGNLSLGGLDRGREVFSRYQRRNEDDLPVFASWHQWMETLINHVDDHGLSRRWDNAQVKSPWLRTLSGSSVFASNWERNFVDQFAEIVDTPVNELHVMAPFYDRDAQALRELIQRTAPHTLHLYLGRDVSVHGESLQHVLESAGAEVHIKRVLSDKNRHEFIHAKLVGAIAGNRGWLLSGSPNLSRAAMLQPVVNGHGNVETAIIAELPPDRVRGAFTPPGYSLQEVALADLSALEYAVDDAPDASFPISLLNAARRSDGRIEIAIKGDPEGRLFLAHQAGQIPLSGLITETSVDEDSTPTIVWITSLDENVLSNRVVVEHPNRLEGWLRERSQTTSRPPDFTEDDWSTPVGQMLTILHENCIFDIDETPASSRARSMTGEDETADESFWERYVQEELKIDPRVERYAAFSAAPHEMDDEIFLLMRQMMDRVRSQKSIRPVGGNGPGCPSDGEGAPWTPHRRIQTRLYNLLNRWCQALADPRLRWIDPLAPARNYLYLVKALYECWAESYLPRDRMIPLVGTLFGSYIRTDRAPGYLGSLSDEERAAAISSVTNEARQFAAALIYCGLRPEADFRNHIFEWQPFLKQGQELGVIAGGGDIENTVRRLIEGGMNADGPRSTTTKETIVQRLTWAESYMDDQYWCQKTARELGLDAISFSTKEVNALYPVVLEVNGIVDPLHDHRVVTLMRQTLEYRQVQGIVIMLPAGRISVRIDDYCYAQIQGLILESNQRVTLPTLISLEEAGSGLGFLMNDELQASA
jgi:hypothetical protein